MADVTVKRIDDFEAIYSGGMRRARAGLGVTSFGMQIEDLPPNFDGYPEHDHSQDGQEEVFIVLTGSASLVVDDSDQHALEPGVLARVGPGTRRKLVPGDDGARILVLGGTPGQAYAPPQWTEEGEPDPTVAKA